MTGLKPGVVAFLDVLGFKGIWNREKPQAVLKKLRLIKSTGKGLQGSDHGGVLVSDDGFVHKVKCISDTVIIVVVPRRKQHTQRMLYKAMYSATWIAAWIIREALQGELPLLFRGCLGAGLMRLDGDFLIGPAVDETASLFEKADGPFFWLSPEALAINDEFSDTFHERLEPTLMVRYHVPLNDGRQSESLVHNYFGIRESPEQWSETRLRIDNAFGTKPLDQMVLSKYSNANGFLDHVESLAQTQRGIYPTNYRLPYWEDLTSGQRFQILKHNGFDDAERYPRRTKTPR